MTSGNDKIRNNLFIWFCVLLVNLSGHTQELSSDEKAALAKLEQDYATGNYPATLANACLFYRSGKEAHYGKGDAILNRVISFQDGNPESKTFGQWAWSESGEIGDLNVALFRAHDLFANLWDHQGNMAPATRDNFLTSCKRVVEAARCRWDTEVFDIGRDFVAYSNIFVLYIQTLTLASERFDDARLRQTARGQWTRWYNHVSFFGIDEFASPMYNQVIFRALQAIHDFCRDERIQKETKEIMDHVYTLQSALTHPRLKIPVSGISRDYRVFLKETDARSAVLTTPVTGYQPPQKAVAINTNRKYPFTVIGKAAINPFIFQSYQLEDAAMGSMTGGACFQQQIHCMAVVGKSEIERAVAFIQGSNTPVNGYTDQKATSTLCVYNRLPALWHLTQWRGNMAEYRETFGEFGIGISAGWKSKSIKPDHIILEAFGYELHLFPFAMQNDLVVPCELVLKHRTSSSPRYHPRPIVFDEYVFPEEADWFGVFLTLTRSDAIVENPGITYTITNGIRTFRTNQEHQIRLFITEKGDTRQLFNLDPALIPLLKFSN